MFPRYFAPRYFAPRYFPKVGAAAVAVGGIVITVAPSLNMSRLRQPSPTAKHWPQAVTPRAKVTSENPSGYTATAFGKTGTFTTADGKTVTVVNGFITEIA